MCWPVPAPNACRRCKNFLSLGPVVRGAKNYAAVAAWGSQSTKIYVFSSFCTVCILFAAAVLPLAGVPAGLALSAVYRPVMELTWRGSIERRLSQAGELRGIHLLAGQLAWGHRKGTAACGDIRTDIGGAEARIAKLLRGLRNETYPIHRRADAGHAYAHRIAHRGQSTGVDAGCGGA